MLKKILVYPYNFLMNYIPNYLIAYIPNYFIRHFYYKKIMRISMGRGSSIHMGTFINKSRLQSKITIGKESAINRKCYLDGRGTLVIGNNVSISPEVHLITADHDINDIHFRYRSAPVEINDYVWIGTRAIILPGTTLGEGSVIAAGAVVNKNVPPYEIWGGIPAKKIGVRTKKLEYSCKWFPPFD